MSAPIPDHEAIIEIPEEVLTLYARRYQGGGLSQLIQPDDANVFLGAEVIEDPAEIVTHNYWRDAAWHHAMRRDDFATKERLGRV